MSMVFSLNFNNNISIEKIFGSKYLLSYNLEFSALLCRIMCMNNRGRNIERG